MRRLALLTLLPTSAAAATAPAQAAPGTAGKTDPWPTMRHDQRNTGRSTGAVPLTSPRPRSFTAGRGIFSTPVVDTAGRITATVAAGAFG